MLQPQVLHRVTPGWRCRDCALVAALLSPAPCTCSSRHRPTEDCGACCWHGSALFKSTVPPAVQQSTPSLLCLLLHTPSCPFFSLFFFAGQCLLFIILPPPLPSPPPAVPFSSCSRAELVGSDMNNSLYVMLFIPIQRGEGIGTPTSTHGRQRDGTAEGAGVQPAGVPVPRCRQWRGRSRVGRGCSTLPAIIRHGQRGGQGDQRRRRKGGVALGGSCGLGEPSASPPRCLVWGWLSPIFPWLPGSVGMQGLRAAVPLL